MTTATLVRCHRCRRVLVDPDWQAVGLGRVCAERLGLERKRSIRVRRPERTEMDEQPVLDGLEINESER